MLQTKFFVLNRKLWGHVTFGDNIFGSKINWKSLQDELQTKFKSFLQDSNKTRRYDKVGWCNATGGFVMRRLPARYFFRKFTTIHNYLQESGLQCKATEAPSARRSYSTILRERSLGLRSRGLGFWQCYIWKTDWIGDEMRGEVMKQAPGSIRSTFEVYRAGKMESKEKKPDYVKPKEKTCPIKKKPKSEEKSNELPEAPTVKYASKNKEVEPAKCEEDADEIETPGKVFSPSDDPPEQPKKKKKSSTTSVSASASGKKCGIPASTAETPTRTSKSSSRTGGSQPAKPISRNRSSAPSPPNMAAAGGGSCPSLPSGPVTCKKPCVPCQTPSPPPCPPPPCPPPPCPPPPCPAPSSPAPKNRCGSPPCPNPCPPCPPPCPPPPPPPCCPPPSCPKMEALQFDPVCKALNFYMLNAPTSIRKDEVLVQVVYSGVCCTDLMIMEGKFPIKCQPVILGHEFSGIACAVGSGVSHVKCGDNIAVNPYGACQVCRYCTRGQFGSCLCEGLSNSIGINKDGGWAEFVVVHKNQVHPLPQCLSLAQAVLVQPLSCVVNALSRLDLQFGADIVIQGVGISGCLWASLLHLQGHRNVIACDISEYKRKLFECLDLKYCILPPERMCDVQADIVIDCTGSGKSIERSIKMLNPNGQLCIFGIPSPDEEISIQPFELLKKEATVISVITNTNSFTKAITLAEMMGCRYLDYEKLGMQPFKLGQYEGALKMKRCGEISKIVFKIQNSK